MRAGYWIYRMVVVGLSLRCLKHVPHYRLLLIWILYASCPSLLSLSLSLFILLPYLLVDTKPPSRPQLTCRDVHRDMDPRRVRSNYQIQQVYHLHQVVPVKRNDSGRMQTCGMPDSTEPTQKQMITYITQIQRGIER